MKIIISLFLILISVKALAHQPKLIKYSPTKENPHEVINPEISKAYYAKLKGEPHSNLCSLFLTNHMIRFYKIMLVVYIAF